MHTLILLHMITPRVNYRFPKKGEVQRLCKLATRSLPLPQLDPIRDISEEPVTDGMNTQGHETVQF